MNQKKSSNFPISKVVIFALCIMFIIAIYANYRISLIQKVNAKLKILEEQGYITDLETLNSSYTYVPQQENAANIYQQAFKNYYKAPNVELEKLPVVGMLNLPSVKKPLSKKMMQDIETYLKKNQKAIKLLYQASTFSKCRYPIDLTQGFLCDLPHLWQLKNGAMLLQLEAIFRAQKNQLPQAHRAIIASLNLGNSMAKEPNLASLLLKIACHNMAIEALERIFNQKKFSYKQLVDLAKILEKSEQESFFSLKKAFMGELAFGTHIFQNINSDTIKRQIGGPAVSPLYLFMYQILGRSEKDFLFFLHFLQKLIKISKLKTPDRFKEVAILENKLANRHTRETFFISGLLLPAVTTVLARDTQHLENIRIARTAIAIEQYKLKHGKIPKDLLQLIPKYLSHIPANPYNGKEVIYKKLAQGYKIYSFGENGKDDAGKRKSANNKKNWDIVFIVNDKQ